MERQSLSWEEELRDNLIDAILKPNFHAAEFCADGIKYVFSGWWLLESPDGDLEKEYESKEEFISDPVFSGKTIKEVNVTGIDLELEP